MNRVLFSILSIFLFLACHKEDALPVSPIPLSITPSVIPSTKAIVDNSTITNQTIGVQITNASGNALYQSGIDNIALSYNNSSWKMASLISLTSSPAKIYAYSPYSSTPGNFSGTGETSSLLLNIPGSQDMNAQTDYLWSAQDKTTPDGNNSITISNTSVNLKMNHSLAQIAFVIYKDNYPYTGSISNIEIENTTTSCFYINKSASNDLKMSIPTGSITGGSTTSSIVASNVGSTINLTADPGNSAATLDGLKNGYLLLVPVTIADQSKIRFKFTIDGNTYSIPTGGTGSLSWIKGNQYIYKIKISNTKGLTIESLTVTSWTDSDSPLYTEQGKQSTANCYIVAPDSSLTFPVGIKGNGNPAAVAGTGLSVTHTAASVSIVWQSTSGLVSIENFNELTQTVRIKASKDYSGNAVLAAKDGSGNILWSWHIWVTTYTPDNSLKMCFNPDNALIFMDRNLGAINKTPADVGCIGMLYQWGRKDPFPCSSAFASYNEPYIYTPSPTTITKTGNTSANNLSNSILNPASFYTESNISFDWYTNTSNGGNDNLWGGANIITPSPKTIFDPCPAGWRVPPFRNGTGISPWSVLIGQTFVWANRGANWLNPYFAGYYPGGGLRYGSDGSLSYGTDIAYYLSASPLKGIRITSNGIISDAVGRSSGCSVRCVKEF